MEADTQLVRAVPLASSRREREAEADAPPTVPPVLEPRPGGIAERFAKLVGPENPVRVFVVALLTSYALLVTAMVFLGLTLIYVVLPTANLDDDDERVSRWLADHRTSDQEHLSWIGSTLAGGLVIPVVIGLCLLVFVINAAGCWPRSWSSRSRSSPGPIVRPR